MIPSTSAASHSLRPLEIAGCSDGECDYHLLWLVTQFFWMVDFGVLLGTVILWVTFRRRSWAWAIAAGGTAITLIIVTTANLIINAALGKGLF